MCTSIVEIAPVEGAGKAERGWIPLTTSVVSYDHPHHADFEEAITIDFLNADLDPGARVAIEISLESARAFAAALCKAIEAADALNKAAGATN
jgi:hypothetical protein